MAALKGAIRFHRPAEHALGPLRPAIRGGAPLPCSPLWWWGVKSLAAKQKGAPRPAPRPHVRPAVLCNMCHARYTLTCRSLIPSLAVLTSALHDCQVSRRRVFCGNLDGRGCVFAFLTAFVLFVVPLSYDGCPLQRCKSFSRCVTVPYRGCLIVWPWFSISFVLSR